MIQTLEKPDFQGLRFALHLGVASPEQPLYKNLVGSTDPLDHIRFAADLGMTGITDNSLKSRPVHVQEAMGNLLAQLGLTMGSFTNSPMNTPEFYWADPDSAYEQAFFDSVAASIAAGKRVGGKDITMTCLRRDTIDQNIQLQVFGERLKRLADSVADADMRIAIEPTSVTRTPFFLVHHIEDALGLMDEHPHPAFRLMFDTGHLHEMHGDIVAAFNTHQSLIDTIQIADVVNRVEPGSGRTDFPAFIKSVCETGFSGLFELEHYQSEDSVAGEQRSIEQLARIVRDAVSPV